MFLIVEGTFATLPRTSRGVAIVLGGDPKGKNFIYTNGNSVIIRDIAVQFCLSLGLLKYWYLMISITTFVYPDEPVPEEVFTHSHLS